MKSWPVLFVGIFLSVGPARAQFDPDLLSGMKARSIGPAAMSGRVVAIDAVESNPDIIYVGAATGGLWKSTDGGTTFKPIFDDQPVASIGAIAIQQRNPDVIWVGTGESTVRNSASVGNGVYRSLDGGKTWSHLGLEKSERIARIIVHPSNRDIAWVAATGPEWGESTERGIFKTEDGGRSWKKVLYVNERTGAADLIVDPVNPDKLFAAMWDFRRWPWIFRSGGPGSGLFVSYDGGSSWKRYAVEDGMPKGQLGRIGLSISRSQPQIVYALVEAEKNTLLRSDDGGKSWKTINEQNDVAPRPFYFSNLRVDPVNPLRIFNLWTFLSLSEDGGKSFTRLPAAAVHPDHHAMWIEPRLGNLIIDGNDGGVSISRDGGKTWRFVESLPLAQFYHVSLDMERPYNIYGGLQDNGSWRGPSAVWERGPIQTQHWQELDFGDGFATAALSNDNSTGYAMSQTGYLIRWDRRSGQRKDIRPPTPKEAALRFNWNSAIATDPFQPETVYYGSQFVHRSDDRGEHWKIISPDLTTNRREWQQQSSSGGLSPDVSGAENFTTIVSIAPSPLTRGVLWVGTDDGRVQLTRDGGATWSSVEDNIRGVAKNSWVPHIEPSRFDAASAYVVFDDHRRSNWTTYVYKTTDWGKSWTSLATTDLRGYALTLIQDTVDSNLLFLGTEFGLYVSLDGGARWMQWKHGLPTVSTMALAIHPRENDLVIGTHGRALYIVDDLTPLRTISAAMLNEPLHLFPIAETQQYWQAQPAGARFRGDAVFRGENRPYGALITFSLNDPSLPLPNEERERTRKQTEREAALKSLPITAEGIPQSLLDEGKPKQGEPATAVVKKDEKGPQAEIEIRDAGGALIRSLKAPVKMGLNRVVWDLTAKPFRSLPREKQPGDDEPTGPEVVPGEYKVLVRFAGHEQSGNLRIAADPRVKTTSEARQANYAALQRTAKLQEALAEALTRLQRTRSDINAIVARSESARGENPSGENPVATAAAALQSRLDSLERRLWQPPKAKGILPDTDAAARLDYVQSSISSSWDAPTEAQLSYLEEAAAIIRSTVGEWNALAAGEVARFRAAALSTQRELLVEEKPVEVP